MDYLSVIYLGHTRNVPLIRSSSELLDGLEPHATIYPAVAGPAYPVSDSRGGEGVPGVRPGGCLEGGIPGTNQGPGMADPGNLRYN